MMEEFEMDSSSEALNEELEEGEVLQNDVGELVCMDQEAMDRLQAEEDAAELLMCSSPTEMHVQRKMQHNMLRFQVVSCQEELEHLRNQNAEEGEIVDPKEKLHLVKYVKMEGKVLKIWECGICSKDFRHQYTLMRHLPTHTDERKYKCDVCEKSFRQMSTLSQHRAIHSNARPYVCEICQKTFNRVSTLISHRRTHFEDKPHKCHVCGKGFHQKGNLKNHMFSHSNERPYRCEICGRGFNQMSNLVVHKVKSHGAPAPGSSAEDGAPRTATQDKFVCKVCSQRFQRKAQLSAHEEAKHGLVKTQTAGRSKSAQQRAKTEPKPLVMIEAAAREKIKPRSTTPKQEDGSTAGLLIDAIQTTGMQEARDRNQTAFALLKSIDGTPSLVKIFDLPNNQQLLIPATSDDLARANASSSKSSQVKVPVVATVSQQMDESGQLVVRIESIESNEMDQKLLDSIESSRADEQVDPLKASVNDDEHIHYVRPLPDGGFEILAEDEAASFLEIVEDDSSSQCTSGVATGDGSNNYEDSAQIVITQDEDGHLMVEGTPLQFLLDNTQQQLQFTINKRGK